MTKEQLTAQIQKECHAAAASMLEGRERTDLEITQAINVFLYGKLAEMELRLRALEEHTSRLDSENSLNRPLM